jgi:hypothetical protein
MAVKTILPVCNAYKRAQHPPIKAEVFQNVVFGQIQSRHIGKPWISVTAGAGGLPSSTS